MSNKLAIDRKLKKGDEIYSPNRRYLLIFQNDGNTVLYDTQSGLRHALWSTNTHGTAADFFVVQRDGNICVYTSAGQPIWATDTGRGDRPPHELVVQDDGNLVLYPVGSTNQPAWASGTYQGAPGGFGADVDRLDSGQKLGINQAIYSSNRSCVLVFQQDGNAVLYDCSDGGVIWSTGTHGRNGAFLTLQGDGNLCVYNTGDSAIWASDTGRGDNPRTTLVVESSGELSIKPVGGNQPIWSTNTRLTSQSRHVFTLDTSPGAPPLQVQYFLRSMGA